MRYWFWQTLGRVEDDRYWVCGPGYASILQDEGREVWPKLSKDPEADYRVWIDEQGDTE